MIFVAQKLSSVKNFAPFKEIERSSYKRYCVGCLFQTAEALRKLNVSKKRSLINAIQTIFFGVSRGDGLLGHRDPGSRSERFESWDNRTQGTSSQASSVDHCLQGDDLSD